jgi:cell division protein FtsI (penicillin-binding protein 3)
MAKISQRLNAQEYYQRLIDFGFNQKTNIDLPYEKDGVFQDVSTFQNEVYKATISYGYGIQVTFIQLLKAYNVFLNDGKSIEPKIASYISFGDKGYFIDGKTSPVISKETAQTMKDILIETVERGSGKKTRIEGLTIGGKTGTAHIAKDGSYVSSYNSSFFGFVTDDNNKTYTIGVSVNEPSGKYFASQTATVVFKEVIETLLRQGYLKKSKK